MLLVTVFCDTCSDWRLRAPLAPLRSAGFPRIFFSTFPGSILVFWLFSCFYGSIVQVNFLALDFDLTILDIHTSGRWPGTPEQLAQRIRPFFQALIPVAVAAGMYVGVVTFSPQVSMISSVLKAAFPDVASQIPIRGDDFSWEYEGRGATDGKQVREGPHADVARVPKHSHMASAAEELTQTHAASITRASTLLVDDDVNNVKIALSEGVKSVWCNPKDPTTMIKELLRLGNPRDTPHPRPAECAP
ncbi:unnamed protein product [Pylaiella littoralis]